MESQVLRVLKQVWGYDSFRPLQEEIVQALLARKDVVAILPTGGGKSLCFQLPALLQIGTTIVISPLISLMKDQVDALKEMGIAAEFLNSSLSEKEARSILARFHNHQLKLLYIAPERLANPTMLSRLAAIDIAQFVIDEAHCISHWGHDFRPEYRALHLLKKQFPQVPIAAFTATATPPVLDDIKNQLALHHPLEFVTSIDRPNLTYRVFVRSALKKQITTVLERHRGEPGIIYCLSRKDVDTLSAFLNDSGFKNLPYHAGLPDSVRKKHQMQFAMEEVDLIVATVAFGMGIDRSNIRYVIHASMPQSLEHYQQEVGRAGRDGLPAWGYLFFGAGDYRIRLQMLDATSQQETLRQKLNHIYDFCITPQCRHRKVIEYFGQTYPQPNCNACDFCLNEVTMVKDALVLSQKILSCVARFKQSYGTDYLLRVLKGDDDPRITMRNHQTLSTYGILKDQSLNFLRSITTQLIGQGYLDKKGEFATLSLTSLGWQVLKGEIVPQLAQPMEVKTKRAVESVSRQKMGQDWSGIDKELFQRLRRKRMELAHKEGVPAFVIFGDKSLKDMALKKPQTEQEFSTIFGVGQTKLKRYAQHFLEELTAAN